MLAPMRPLLVSLAVLFAGLAPLCAQTVELYQGKPSLYDAENQVRVTYDEPAHALRFDPMQADVGPQTPSWGCHGQGALLISDSTAIFRSPAGGDFVIDKRDYRIDTFEDKSRWISLFGETRACSFDVGKLRPWTEHLLTQAWLETGGAIEQFQMMTEKLRPGEPSPAVFKPGTWGSCGSTKYTGEPVSMYIVGADLHQYFRLIHEISSLNVDVDPNVSGTFHLRVYEMPWDLTLPILAHRHGLECKFEGDTMSVRRGCGAKCPPPEIPTAAIDSATLIDFSAYISEEDLKKDPAAKQAYTDFDKYRTAMVPALRKLGIVVLGFGSSTFHVQRGAQHTTFKGEKPIGYYFAAPGREPRIVYGVHTDAEILAIAREYFHVPAGE